MNASPDSRLCPLHIREAFLDYLEKGVPPAGFVRACLENNLMGAFKQADRENLEALPHIMAWLYWEMPSNKWGWSGAVERHLAAKRATHKERSAQ